MSDVTRRWFLQLMGLGTATIAAPSGLFGFINPDILAPSTDLSTHYILERIPGVLGPARNGGGALSFHQGVGNDGLEPGFHAPLLVETGVDPHAAFYKAALEIQQSFSNMIMGMQAEVGKYGHLVTVAYNPICAIPSTTRYRGVDLFAEFKTYCFYESGLGDFLQCHKIVSMTGGYPIDPPSGIQMDRMMKMDQEVWGRDLRSRATDEFLRKHRTLVALG